MSIPRRRRGREPALPHGPRREADWPADPAWADGLNGLIFFYFAGAGRLKGLDFIAQFGRGLVGFMLDRISQFSPESD